MYQHVPNRMLAVLEHIAETDKRCMCVLSGKTHVSICERPLKMTRINNQRTNKQHAMLICVIKLHTQRILMHTKCVLMKVVFA